MYEENIRNLVAQRKKENLQAHLSQTMTTKALQRMHQNTLSKPPKPFVLTEKQMNQIDSVHLA